MPFWQIGYLVKEKTYSSDSGTIYIDLPSDEQLSYLMVEASVTNTAAADTDFERGILEVVKNVSDR